MTDRERLIDTMDEIFAEEFIADGSETERVLAALEAAGYAWYRPDDCECIETQLHMDATRGFFCLEVEPAGEYRLVPVGGDS